MLKIFICLAIIFLQLNGSNCFLGRNFYGQQELINVEVNSKPLFLTPFIEQNELDKGRTLAEVHGLPVDVKSYSGFLTVNKQYNSNMFFWFFPAMVLIILIFFTLIH